MQRLGRGAPLPFLPALGNRDDGGAMVFPLLSSPVSLLKSFFGWRLWFLG